MRRVTFLRHGRSRADDEQKFEGRYDSPLTDEGRRQVARLVEQWGDEPQRAFDLLVASPLLRAAETAQIVGEAYGLAPEHADKWMEMDNGGLAGLTYSEGTEQFPRPDRSGRFDRIADRTGESRIAFHARAAYALEELMNREFGSALVVAHGGILQAATRCALGIAPPSDYYGTGFRFGDLSHLDLVFNDERDTWIVAGLSHLRETS